MATEQAANGEVEALERTVLEDGLACILTAGGGETTRGGSEGRDDQLVETDGHQQDEGQQAEKKMEETLHSFS